MRSVRGARQPQHTRCAHARKKKERQRSALPGLADASRALQRRHMQSPDAQVAASRGAAHAARRASRARAAPQRRTMRSRLATAAASCPPCRVFMGWRCRSLTLVMSLRPKPRAPPCSRPPRAAAHVGRCAVVMAAAAHGRRAQQGRQQALEWAAGAEVRTRSTLTGEPPHNTRRSAGGRGVGP